MYAVVKTGGKQYRVAKDDVIVVEKLAGEPCAELELDQVLMLDNGETVKLPVQWFGSGCLFQKGETLAGDEHREARRGRRHVEGPRLAGAWRWSDRDAIPADPRPRGAGAYPVVGKRDGHPMRRVKDVAINTRVNPD